MSAASMYTLAPEQYLRVLTAGLTGLLDSIVAGAKRDSLCADVDALLLIAYQGQEVASEEETPAAKNGKKEAPKEVQGPLFAIATDLEEAAPLLRGVLNGLEHATDADEQPRGTHLRILLDRFGTELARVETQTHAVYAMHAGTGKAEAAMSARRHAKVVPLPTPAAKGPERYINHDLLHEAREDAMLLLFALDGYGRDGT